MYFEQSAVAVEEERAEPNEVWGNSKCIESIRILKLSEVGLLRDFQLYGGRIAACMEYYRFWGGYVRIDGSLLF